MVRMDDENMVILAEAAKLLGISEAGVRARVRRGKLRAYRPKFGGRGMWFKRADLVALEPVEPEEQSDG